MKYLEVFCPVAKKRYELVQGETECPACGEKPLVNGHILLDPEPEKDEE